MFQQHVYVSANISVHVNNLKNSLQVVVLVAVLNFAGYMRCFAVWVCGFVNCVKYFDKTSRVCKIVF